MTTLTIIARVVGKRGLIYEWGYWNAAGKKMNSGICGTDAYPPLSNLSYRLEVNDLFRGQGDP